MKNIIIYWTLNSNVPDSMDKPVGNFIEQTDEPFQHVGISSSSSNIYKKHYSSLEQIA